MPGVAAWVWFELLAWHGAVVTRGRLLDASGADSLRTVERALAYLEREGFVVRTDAGWASVLTTSTRQSDDTSDDKTVASDATSVTTKLSHEKDLSDSDGDKTASPVTTKLSHSTVELSVPHEKDLTPKETNETNETNTTSLRSVVKTAIPKKFEPEKLELSDHLKSLPGFASFWLEWVTHRREIRKPLTPTSVKQQLEMLEVHPDPVGCIRVSLQSGWAGLFAERGLPLKPAIQSGTSPPRRNGINDPDYWAFEQQRADAKIDAIINGGTT